LDHYPFLVDIQLMDRELHPMSSEA
jgi:hypothetical protein